MTRRHLGRLLLAESVSASACSTASRETLARLAAMCEAGDFAVFGAREVVDSNSDLAFSAITVSGGDAGYLQLPDSYRRQMLSIAPDGAWAGWVPEGSLPDAYGQGGQPIVRLTNDPKSARTLRYKGWYGLRLTLSSNAKDIALIMSDREGARLTHRLVLLEQPTGDIAEDLSSLVAGLDLRKVERLRLSSNARRLVIGWPDSFLVVDVPARKLVFTGRGRFPCLSPSGEELAFMDPGRKLVVVTLATGARMAQPVNGKTYGVGSWTPDGSLLLAFVWTPLALDAKLVAIDCKVGRYCDITRLDEWNLGQYCSLIKRTLLSPLPS